MLLSIAIIFIHRGNILFSIMFRWLDIDNICTGQMSTAEFVSEMLQENISTTLK